MPGLVRGSEGPMGEEGVQASGFKPMKEETFWQDYDKLSVGQIIAQGLSGGKAFRDKIADREEGGKGRKPIVDIMRVNWNS